MSKTTIEFGKDISKLNDIDLPRYKDFLLDKICGEQPEKNRKESFRMKIIDRVEQVNEEIKKRNGHRGGETGGDSSEREG